MMLSCLMNYHMHLCHKGADSGFGLAGSICVLCPSAPIARHIVPTILLIQTLYAEARAMV